MLKIWSVSNETRASRSTAVQYLQPQARHARQALAASTPTCSTWSQIAGASARFAAQARPQCAPTNMTACRYERQTSAQRPHLQGQYSVGWRDGIWQQVNLHGWQARVRVGWREERHPFYCRVTEQAHMHSQAHPTSQLCEVEVDLARGREVLHVGPDVLVVEHKVDLEEGSWLDNWPLQRKESYLHQRTEVVLHDVTQPSHSIPQHQSVRVGARKHIRSCALRSRIRTVVDTCGYQCVSA